MKPLRNLLLLLMAAGVAGSLELLAADVSYEEAAKLGKDIGELEYLSYLEAMNTSEGLSASEKARFEELELRYGPERNGFDPLDNQGGPDAFGYSFMDNQGGDTVTYEWIELRGDPEAVWINAWTTHDDGYSTTKHPFGFDFPFYGLSYDSFRVMCNGNIQFTSTSGSLSNGCLPSSVIAGPAVCLFWNDLHLDRGGIPTGVDVVGYRNFGDYLVLEFDSVGNYSTSCVGSLKFEAILYADGRIKMQYNQLILGTGTACDSTMTIGIQSNGTGGSAALTYVCNTTGIQPVEELAILFYLPPMGTLSGTVSSSEGGGVGSATVRALGTQLATITDGSGNYTFPTIPVGTYTVVASKHGFEADTLSNVVIVESQNTDADFTLPWLGLVSYTSTDVPQAIPALGTVTSTLTINDVGAIENLDVMLNITHTYDGDLRVSLTSPDGVSCVLVNRRGGTGDNFNNTIFDDEADSLISQAAAPFAGVYRPEQPLSIFNAGVNLQGTWTLTIEDLATGNSGTLNTWELYVLPGATAGGTVTGTVTSEENGEPVVGATVEIEELNATRTTSAGGTYSFSFVAAGTYTMNFNASHFDPLTIPNVVVSDGQQTVVNAALAGAPPSYNQDFETTGGEWVPDPETGGWEWGTPTVPANLDPHSGTNLWGTVLNANYPTNACFNLTLTLGLAVESASATVEFWRWWDMEANFDGCNFNVSTDQGATWEVVEPVGGYGGSTNAVNDCNPSQPAWTGHTGGTWTYVVIPLADYVGQVPMYRFTFGSDGSVQYPGFFFDDLTIWGLQVPDHPVGLTINGEFDDRIRLNWLPLDVPPQGVDVAYDNGHSSPNVDGIGWWSSQPESGWITAHYQHDGPVEITKVNAYFTDHAVAGTPIQVGVFADNGNGLPEMTPLAVMDAVQLAPFNEYKTFELAEPVTVSDGSFFVGVRQLTSNTLALGADESVPFIRSTFFHSSNGEWTSFEPVMMMNPMLGACVNGTTDDNWLAPMATVHPANVKLTSAAKSAAKPVVSKADVKATDIAPAYKSTITTADAWRMAGREFFAVEPRAPHVRLPLTNGRPGGSPLDDVAYYKIYRNNVFLANDADPPYDDVVGSAAENITYSYFLTAIFDDSTESEHSDTVSAAANMAPAAPGNVAGDPQGQQQMRITWTDPATNEDGTNCVDLTSLAVYRDGVLLGTVNPGVQQYLDTPPEPMTFYTWSVTARDEVPNEGAGGSVTGAVQSPWIEVEYEWIDIADVGTPVVDCDDCNQGPFPLGFTMTYYGAEYTEFYVCSNGWLSFTSNSNSRFNGVIPDTDEPNTVVYGFWDDLYPSAGDGQVLYYYDPEEERFVLSFLTVQHFPSGNPETFQIVLYPDGGVRVNWQVVANISSSTHGVENADGTEALMLANNGAGVLLPENETAVQFWGSHGPEGILSGLVRQLSDNSLEADVTVTASNVDYTDFALTDALGQYTLELPAGLYSVTFTKPDFCDTTRANILIEDQLTTTLDQSLRNPAADVSVTSIQHEGEMGEITSSTFDLDNDGNCALEYAIAADQPWLSALPASGEVAPGGSVEITVYYDASDLGMGDYDGELTITHNAAGTPEVIPVELHIPSAAGDDDVMPTEFALLGNYPNPFNAVTEIRYDVPQASLVTITLYNVLGQEVRTLVNGIMDAGRHVAVWDSRDNRGLDMTSGLYLVRMEASGHVFVGKVMLLK